MKPALTRAAQNGKEEVVETLLAHGALDRANSKGDTAIMLAEQGGHTRVLEALHRHASLDSLE